MYSRKPGDGSRRIDAMNSFTLDADFVSWISSGFTFMVS